MFPQLIQQLMQRIAMSQTGGLAGRTPPGGSPALPPGASRPGPGYTPPPEGRRVPPGLGGRPGMHPPIQHPWQPRQLEPQALWGQSAQPAQSNWQEQYAQNLQGAQPAQVEPAPESVQADPSRHAQAQLGAQMGKQHPEDVQADALAANPRMRAFGQMGRRAF